MTSYIWTLSSLSFISARMLFLHHILSKLRARLSRFSYLTIWIFSYSECISFIIVAVQAVSLTIVLYSKVSSIFVLLSSVSNNRAPNPLIIPIVGCIHVSFVIWFHMRPMSSQSSFIPLSSQYRRMWSIDSTCPHVQNCRSSSPGIYWKKLPHFILACIIFHMKSFTLFWIPLLFFCSPSQSVPWLGRRSVIRSISS